MKSSQRSEISVCEDGTFSRHKIKDSVVSQKPSVFEDVGIDDLAICVPKRYIDTGDLADLRGVPREKFTDGIGIRKMGIFTEDEDVITVASDAILDLINKNNLDARDIGRLYAATESSIDESKPLVCFIIKKLEENLGVEFNHVQGLENKFACLGGSYSLFDTCNWVLSKMNKDKVGIVVCADEAKYDLNSSGEPTQGAGAVAMLIKESPRLLNLDFTNTGVFTQDSYDFYRPFGKSTPIVNGELSTFSYLYAMRVAFDRYVKSVRKNALSREKEEEDRYVLTDIFDYLVFHTPYPKITKHALAFLLRHELRGTDRWERICKEIGDEPIYMDGKTLESVFSDKKTMAGDYLSRKKLFGSEEFKNIYERKVLPSQWAISEIGNTYTASIFISLASMLTLEEEKANLEEGKRIGFGAYGSGSGSLVFSGALSHDYKPVVKGIRLREKLNTREKLLIEEYVERRMQIEDFHTAN
ncbi:MAG: hypothetical protein MOIL_00104 [Candidatus Methanolliviera sp. GoM_oil]|nr:MAG: hypothetical protein MOIL_00104 [Candidatus Methanolliviera sp. GoM_oil]